MKLITIGAVLIALSGLPMSGCGNGQSAGSVSVSDDFDDERTDTAKWGPDEAEDEEAGEFFERDGVLELVGSGGYLDRPWIATLFPYDSSWEVQLDIENTVDPESEENGQYPSMGLAVFKHGERGNRLRYDLYTDTVRHYRGFHLDTWEDDWLGVSDDSLAVAGLLHGALRIRFDSTTKLLTLYYDEDVTDGYQWVAMTVVSVGDGHPADKSVDWNMSETDLLSVSVYGVGEEIAPGMLRADNFETIGGFRY